MNRSNLPYIRPLLYVFVALTAAIVVSRSWLMSQGIDPLVLLIGHIVIFAATFISLLVLLRGEKTSRPQVFVRSMYGSFMIRFFVILIAAFIYIFTAGKAINKPALVICAVLYIVYAAMEITMMTRSLKGKKDG